MKAFAYQTLEKIINRALSLDPEAKEQLAELAGNTVALKITDWNLMIILALTNDGVKCLSEEPETIDATLSGPLFGIAQTACSGGNPTTMRQVGLRMEGDIQLAEKLKWILSGLDLDWEEPLSRFIGPTLAGGVGRGARKASQVAKSAFHSGINQLSTFLKTDSQCLPSEAEVTQFSRAVTVLRYDVDRLEARINQWLSETGEAP